MKLLHLLALATLAAMIVTPVDAAEWQRSVAERGGKKNDSTRVWLWILLSCARMRGVVVAPHNVEDVFIVEHSRFRAALADLNLAEVWRALPVDHWFRSHIVADDCVIQTCTHVSATARTVTVCDMLLSSLDGDGEAIGL